MWYTVLLVCLFAGFFAGFCWWQDRAEVRRSIALRDLLSETLSSSHMSSAKQLEAVSWVMLDAFRSITFPGAHSDVSTPPGERPVTEQMPDREPVDLDDGWDATDDLILDPRPEVALMGDYNNPFGIPGLTVKAPRL